MTTTRAALKRAATAAHAAVEPGPDAIGTRRSIVIEAVEPEVDGGDAAVKRVVGDELRVTADIFADGHDLLDAALLVRRDDQSRWTETPMRLVSNDRWSGTVRLRHNAMHRYTIEAWRDAIGSWREAITKKLEAGQPVATELAEARVLLRATQLLAGGADARLIDAALAREGRARTDRTRAAALTDDRVVAAARRHPDRSTSTRYRPELPLVVDRETARFSAWYELFPRSQGRDPAHPRPTTLREAEWRLPQVAAMGFDVVYLPPVHPIGRTNRKGRDNAVTARRGDPGSPWAIGRDGGGHTEVAPELGGLDALEHFRRRAEANGLEVALDLALQASPDHPWVRQHPEWFRHAPDGTIKYAENPPKRYEDIYPFEFAGASAADREALWRAWLEVVLTWVGRGIRIFRVDNPHTKPVAFWRWLIAEVQAVDPGVIFLSEAFTTPKRMKALAKAGFSQSYTYFTWRESRDELRDYLTELTAGPMREYFRGNLWPNTPDIFPHHLDHGRGAFAIRAVLAATLSPSWGIYSGFELCEQGRLDDREEYAHSEKYEIRARDWDAPGTIRPLVSGLNRLRRAWPSLQLNDNLRFEAVTGERSLFYRKAIPAGEVDPLTGSPSLWRDPVYVAVNCDPSRAEEAILHPDLPAIGIDWADPYLMVDLLTGRSRRLRGAEIQVELDPARLPYRVFTIRPVTGSPAR
ncbi:MAG TPA: alpha-1,4-glucan--maltose-1-phosphate maltosyltransferase [Candidatus Limnocylindria bacterium]|jgi:starch synthase (maltosyl-transferring)|nr:alpha-1,4-glucan--maltose-1-phosphate maltosyltransferase [Candidatus Limnocylindria bacterium]